MLTEANFEDLKSKGDAAFRSGSYADAYELYSSAEKQCPGNVNVLLNKSITALRMGEKAKSLRDAQSAHGALEDRRGGDVLNLDEVKDRRAKAYYREGSALEALGRWDEALRAYRAGLRAKPGESGLCRALRNVSHHLQIDWLSRYFRDLIVDAQQPNRFSSRDGKLLKPPIDRYALCPSELQVKVRETVLGREEEFRGYVLGAWSVGQEPKRCLLSAIRAYCYLSMAKGEEEGAVEQSLKDAKAALAYMPKRGFARAFAVHSAVLEHLGEYAGAAIDMCEAKTLHPKSEEHVQDFQRLRNKLTDDQRGALDKGGGQALRQWMEEERERNLPEFMRKRPKYFYYYEWMRSRIAATMPELEPKEVDKLLTMDVDDLDAMLTEKEKHMEAIEAGEVKAVEAPPEVTIKEQEVLELDQLE